MAYTIDLQTRSGDIDNRVVGRVTTDAGAAVGLEVNLGFAPRYVQLVNLTDLITHEWYAGMDADSALMTIATGVRTLETSDGVTVDERGFTIPAAVMVASKVYAFVAHN